MLVLAVPIPGWLGYCAWTCLKADAALNATLVTIRLVEKFVGEEGRWPKSWDELRSSPASSGISQASFEHLRRVVYVSFDANTAEIAAQDPMVFNAIGPRGRCNEYLDSVDLVHLQATVRQAVGNPIEYDGADED